LRWFHALPIGGRATYIKAHIPKVECKDCQTNRQIKIGFADSRFTFTRALGRYVLGLSRFMTIKAVSNHLQLSWDIVKTIQKRYLQKRYKKPNLKGLDQIAIDEICIGKGRYLTVLLNLKSGAVIFVGDGKGSEALEPFWEKIKGKNSVQIKAVAVDMSPAYTKAVREHLPKAKIVYDHFHVIKLFNEKLSDFRRMLFNDTANSLGKTVLKGSRWLLLTAREALALKPDKMSKLDSALSLNKPLSTAYYMKEDLRQLWSWDDKETAS
jgi:transposase